MQIVDEQQEHLVLQVLASAHQILEPVVNVQRIKGRVLRQIAFRYVADDGDLLANDAQQLQIVRRPRCGGRKACDSMHPHIGVQPAGRLRVNLRNQAALAGAVIAVYENRTVPGAVAIAELHAAANPSGHRAGQDARAGGVIGEQTQVGGVLVEDLLHGFLAALDAVRVVYQLSIDGRAHFRHNHALQFAQIVVMVIVVGIDVRLTGAANTKL